MLYCLVKNKQTMRVCRKPAGVIQGPNGHTIGILVIYLQKLQVEFQGRLQQNLQGRLLGIFRDTIEILSLVNYKDTVGVLQRKLQGYYGNTIGITQGFLGYYRNTTGIPYGNHGDTVRYNNDTAVVLQEWPKG